MQQAGKTTFLTSLIQHLRDHDPTEFPLETFRVKHLQGLENARGIPQFPYLLYRDQIHHKRWPAKTTALSEYRCRLDFSGGPWISRIENGLSETELSLVDIPGERLADLSMAGVDYAAWSDLLLQIFTERFHSDEESRAFRNLLDSGSPLAAEETVLEFKRVLARLVFHYMPVITPSTLIVDQKGQYVPRDICQSQDAEALARGRIVGIAPDAEFAPLSHRARAANPTLAETFASHYQRYHDDLVEPLANKLYTCDQLVILLDVASLLAGGPPAYEGCRHMLGAALRFLAPGRDSYTATTDTLIRFITGGHAHLKDALTTSSIKRIAFVASQADRVHHDDFDKLCGLVRQMVEPVVEDVLRGKSLGTEYFACAAVNSSASLQYPKIEGDTRDSGNTQSVSRVVVEASKVPDRWPRNQVWKAGDYFFPHFQPQAPINSHLPPPQIGLNKVVSYILGLT